MKNHNSLSLSLSLSLDSLSAFSFMALSKLSPFSLFHSQCQLSLQENSVMILHILSDSRGTSGRTVRDPHLPSQYGLEPFTCEQAETKISVTKNVHKSLKYVCSCQGCSTLAEKVNGYTNDTTFKDLKRII